MFHCNYFDVGVDVDFAFVVVVAVYLNAPVESTRLKQQAMWLVQA